MGIREHGVSSVSSTSTGQHDNDLDLDSLFKRLDKYTAEMDEVEARLKGGRRSSDESIHPNSARFSFGVDPQFDDPRGVLLGSDSRRASSLIRSSFAMHRESEKPGLAVDQASETSQHPQSASTNNQSLPQGEPQLGPDWHAEPLEKDNTDSPVLENTKPSVDQNSGEYSDCDESNKAPHRPWTLPPRTSSRRAPPIGELVDRGGLPATLHRRALTGPGEPTTRKDSYLSKQARPPSDLQERLPPVPRLSHAGSTATLNSPPTPLFICSSKEDQLRRELESFALREGAETLKLRYKNRKPPTLSFVDSDGEEEEWLGPEGANDQQPADGHRLRRERSILSIFQRKKSAVEQVIDMYLDDTQVEKPLPSRTWSTKSSRSIPARANLTKSPSIPPLPQKNG